MLISRSVRTSRRLQRDADNPQSRGSGTMFSACRLDRTAKGSNGAARMSASLTRLSPWR